MIKIILLLLPLQVFAVTKVKPLYINSLGHSTQVSPTRDYLSTKGIVLNGDETTQLFWDGTGSLRISGSTSISETFAVTKLQFSDGTSMTTAATGSGGGSGGDAGTLDGIDSTGFLQVLNNLSDLNNFPQARFNLGLGSLSTQNSTAISVTGGNISTSGWISATGFSGDGAHVSNVNATSVNGFSDISFLKVANNLSDLNNTNTARSNLGLGTMAVQNSSAVSITGGDLSISGYVTATGFTGDGSHITNINATTISGAASSSFLWRANNLSDLANTTTARSNLGLGTIATQNSNAISVTGGDISTSGAITAATFSGNGSGVTNVNASLLNSQAGSFYLARANHTGTQLSTTISDFNEASQDAVGTVLTNNNPITWTYDDTANTITAGLNYNATNLKLTSNFLNTIQDINSTATPTFGGETINGSSLITNHLVVGASDSISGGSKFSVAGDISGTSAHVSGTVFVKVLRFEDQTSMTTAATGGSSLFTDGGSTTYLTDLTDNLGIGVQTTTAKLDVSGLISGSNFTNSGTITNTGNFANGGNMTNTGSFANLSAGYFLSTLNVGSGTFSTNGVLNVMSNGTGAVLETFQNSDTGYTATDGSNVGLSANEDLQLMNQEAKAITFGTNNTARGIFDSNGNLGIGPGSTPGATLDVAGAISATTLSIKGSQATSGSSVIGTYEGIGTTSEPASGGAKLTVNGGISMTGLFTTSGGASINPSGRSSWDWVGSKSNAYIATFQNTSVTNGSLGIRVDGFSFGGTFIASGGSGTTGGYGLYGQNSNNVSTNSGVRGDVGAGAQGSQYGGYFQARTTGSLACGAFAEQTTNGITAYGLYGKSASTLGFGLYGFNSIGGYGMYSAGPGLILNSLTVSSSTSGVLGGAAFGTSGQISGAGLLSSTGASITGSFVITGPNQRLVIPSGGNNIAGTCTLVIGTCTVSNTSVTARSIILLTEQNNSGALGTPSISARTPGTSFVITSTSPTDTSLVGYLIIEP